MNIEKIFCYECNYYTYSLNERDTRLNCKSKQIELGILFNNISEVKPKSIVITLSFGTLDPFTYSEVDILHVGVSNSKCQVYNFWNDYKVESPKGIWSKTICIEISTILKEIADIDDKLFDSYLDKNLVDQKNKFGKYHQLDNNCFDYVCRFLNFLFEAYNYDLKKMDKNEFCECYIKDTINEFEKYSKIFKRLYKEKVFTVNEVEDCNFSKPTVIKICDVCGIIVAEGKYFHCEKCVDFDICFDCNSTYPHLH